MLTGSTGTFVRWRASVPPREKIASPMYAFTPFAGYE